MYTEFHINANALDITFLKNIRAMFKNKPISITIEEEQDETEYLLQSKTNRKMLLESMKQAEKGELIKVNIGKVAKR